MQKKLSIKISALILALAMLISFIAMPMPVHASTSQAVQPPGEGTAASPFLVSTPEHFRFMRQSTHSMASSRYFVLLNDITITRDFTVNDFHGTFDGRGHTIYIDIVIPDNVSFSGIFIRNANTAVIGNVHVSGSIVFEGRRGGNTSLGGLVGTNFGTIFNSSSDVTIVAPTANDVNRPADASGRTGGLVGFNYGTIVNSYASGDATGSFIVGGLVGTNTGIIINSLASGNVRGDENVGALVGNNTTNHGRSDARIHQSDAIGNVEWAGGRADRRSGQAQGIGGMVGRNADGAIIDDHPLQWFLLGSEVVERTRFAPGREPAEHVREAQERAAAQLAILDYFNRVGWGAPPSEGAFGDGPLTDIQREVLDQSIASWEALDQMEIPTPAPGGNNNRQPSNNANASTITCIRGTDFWYAGLSCPCDDCMLQQAIFMFQSDNGTMSAADRDQLMAMLNELGRGALIEEMGLNQWGLDILNSFTAWAGNVLVDTAEGIWDDNFGQNRFVALGFALFRTRG